MQPRPVLMRLNLSLSIQSSYKVGDGHCFILFLSVVCKPRPKCALTSYFSMLRRIDCSVSGAKMYSETLYDYS